LTELAAQPHDVPDSASDSDCLDVPNLANDFKMHYDSSPYIIGYSMPASLVLDRSAT
jgi:hypothetical protein